MGTSDVTRSGLEGVRPDREAVIGANAGEVGGRRGRRRRSGLEVVAPPEFRSYYGQPILHDPTWAPLDIAGYFFLGGLAGASSALAGAAELSGRPGLARALKLSAGLALPPAVVALVHDLGRPSRFYNMLRVFKPTSPMSVGSWILSAYGPAAFGAAAISVLGDRLPPLARALGRPATLVAAVTGPGVAAYTAVLVSDTAIPAWHRAQREMPFLFVASAASAAAGAGLIGAPAAECGPAARLGAVAGATEVAVGRVMRRSVGEAVTGAYETGRAGRYLKAAEALTLLGSAGAATAAAAGTRTPLWARAASGLTLLAGSALTRFGVFYAGVASARDPQMTVQPQKEEAPGG